MTVQATKLNETYYITCPHCVERNHTNAVITFKHWFSNPNNSPVAKQNDLECDTCLGLFNVEYAIATEEFKVTRSENRNSLVLMRSMNNDGEDPIYVLVKTPEYKNAHRNMSEDEKHASDHYYFTEHTCPTNYIEVEQMIYRGDPDPHGVFEFVRRICLDEYDKLVREYNKAVSGELIRSPHVLTSKNATSQSLEWQVLLVPEAYPDQVDEVFSLIFPHIPEYARKLMGKKVNKPEQPKLTWEFQIPGLS